MPHIADVEVLRGLRRDEFRIDEDVLERLAFRRRHEEVLIHSGEGFATESEGDYILD